MMTHYVIRKAEFPDIPDLSRLLTLLFSIEKDFEPNDCVQKHGLEMMLNDDTNRCVLVAALDNAVIGMVTCQILVSTAEGGPAALIEDLIVDIQHRGKGLGKKLLYSVEEWAVQRGASRLQLLADKTNTPALAFYKKNSWDHTQLICLRKKL